ncbi:MAG TPA: hypothetical protein PK629_08770 [Oscillospiraceae bacterium]|nr:hypothetical protein [Oscillospiraceae bacterium]HPF56068.1 hypothetical protein [Clostridiales bacterium]HPK36402.1 hypothetical protein [Oscillospiraceae bacterium]HPR76526.1 hypothetical protein [Oscillospiraceae bacterium]
MAKKKNRRVVTTNSGEVLPQNIAFIGEQTADEDKKIYISQPVYKAVHRFSKGKTSVETGGVLVGSTVSAFGKMNILISGFIEAKFTASTATTLTFTHETWKSIHSELEKKYSGLKIVGWIHTHPDYGIFLSENDKFIHGNFFKEEQQIAYVVDPVQNSEGFFFWKNGVIERSKGFYIYDKTGVTIQQAEAQEDDQDSEKSKASFSARDILLGALVISVILLSISLIGMQKRISNLLETQKLIIANMNTIQQEIIIMQQSELSEIDQTSSAEVSSVPESSEAEQGSGSSESE